MNRRSCYVAAIGSLAALCLASAPATAKPADVQTGRYKATGDIAFTFTVKKGPCPPGTPESKVFSCFFGVTDPKYLLDCPDAAGYQPDYEDFVSFPYNMRIPKNGKISDVSEAYYSNGVVASTTIFKIKIKKNGTAKGWVKKEAPTDWGPAGTCSTGKLSFTAKRK
ncbi:MAG: hypothetical protein MUD05_03030 [Candidatus Nanopelagicales bacterium]|nr:hypothetical protein [Candidatus Nanopelagicales bacterium]